MELIKSYTKWALAFCVGVYFKSLILKVREWRRLERCAKVGQWQLSCRCHHCMASQVICEQRCMNSDLDVFHNWFQHAVNNFRMHTDSCSWRTLFEYRMVEPNGGKGLCSAEWICPLRSRWYLCRTRTRACKVWWSRISRPQLQAGHDH